MQSNNPKIAQLGANLTWRYRVALWTGLRDWPQHRKRGGHYDEGGFASLFTVSFFAIGLHKRW